MLEPRDIMRLKLDSVRYKAHCQMPSPTYVRKPLIGQFCAIGESVLGDLLGIDPVVFQAQLSEARDLGTSYVYTNAQHQKIGISAATSKINGGPVINKNIIVPVSNILHSPLLNEHIIIGAFVRSPVVNGVLENPDDVEVAGWTRASEVLKWKEHKAPFNFHTSLAVMMMPCSMLNPMSTLPQVTR